MTTEPVCLCGHKKGQHKLVKRNRDGEELYRGCCFGCSDLRPCLRYREVLSWPNSGGAWYVDAQYQADIVYAVEVGRDCYELLVFGVQRRFTRDAWEEKFGRTRFSLLTEPNILKKK